MSGIAAVALAASPTGRPESAKWRGMSGMYMSPVSAASTLTTNASVSSRTAR